MNRNGNQVQALFDALEVLIRYRWRFVVPFFVMATLVIGASLLMPRQYEAEAIFERRTDMVLNEITSRGGSDAFQENRQSLKQALAGPPALDQMIQTLREQLKAEGIRVSESTLRELRRKTEQTVLVRYDIADTTLDRIRITFVGNDPVLSRMAVNILVANFIAEREQKIQIRLRQSEEFFSKEAVVSREQIEQIENEKLAFEIEHAALLPNSPSSIQVTMAEGRLALADLTERRDGLTHRLAAVRAQYDQEAEQIPSVITIANPARQRMAERIDEMAKELEAMLTVQKMTERHPDVQDLSQHVQTLERELAAMPEEVISHRTLTDNPKRVELKRLIGELEADLAAVTEQARNRERALAEMEEQSVRFFPVRAQYGQFERRIQQAQRRLGFWEENLRRVQMSLSAEDGNRGVQFAFVSPCGQLRRPASPNLVHVLLASMMLGIIGGGLGVLFSYRSDDSFSSTEQLAQTLGQPVIGGVSEIISSRQRRARWIRNTVIFPLHTAALALMFLLFTGVLYVNLRMPDDYEQLKRNPVRFVVNQFAGPVHTRDSEE